MIRAAAAMVPTQTVLHWGWFSIEVTNLLIIVAMVILFVLALVVPFGRGHRAADDLRDPS